MCFVEGQFLQEWPGEVQIYGILLVVQISSRFGTNEGKECNI